MCLTKKNIMKKLLIPTLCLICFPFFISCDKEEKETNNMSTTEGVELAAMTLSKNSMGISLYMENSVEAANLLSIEPTQNVSPMKKSYSIQDNTLTVDSIFTNPDQAIVTYKDTIHATYTLSINEQLQPIIDVNYTSKGEFDGPRLQNYHTGNGSYNLTQFYQKTTCTLNGNFYRTANGQSKIYAQSKYNSECLLACHDIIIDKNTKKIMSGNTTLTIWGNIPSKGDFSFIGSVDYLGNDKARLTINGTKFLLNLINGNYQPE